MDQQQARPMAAVISLQKRRACDTIQTLCKLLDLARAGEVEGLVFAAKIGRARHERGITGAYAKDKTNAIGAVTELLDAVKRMPDENQ